MDATTNLVLILYVKFKHISQKRKIMKPYEENESRET
jgi:hypothetical protein